MIDNAGWSWAWTKTDRIIHRGSCYLGNIIISSDGGGNTYAIAYDGQEATAKEIIRVDAYDEHTYNCAFRYPVRCTNGIYITVIDHCAGVLVIYKPFIPGKEEKS